MKPIETKLSTPLVNPNRLECDFCGCPIAADDVMVAGDANDGSAKIAGSCCMDQLAITWYCDLPDTPLHVAGAFINAYVRRKAGLGAELGETCVDGAMIATAYVDMEEQIWMPGWYHDYEIIAYAESHLRPNWSPELVAAAQAAESQGKKLEYITWPDGVQVALATHGHPTDDELVYAYRKAARTLTTHQVSGQEAQSAQSKEGYIK